LEATLLANQMAGMGDGQPDANRTRRGSLEKAEKAEKAHPSLFYILGALANADDRCGSRRRSAAGGETKSMRVEHALNEAHALEAQQISSLGGPRIAFDK
jgi:hypothetical protein